MSVFPKYFSNIIERSTRFHRARNVIASGETFLFPFSSHSGCEIKRRCKDDTASSKRARTTQPARKSPVVKRGRETKLNFCSRYSKVPASNHAYVLFVVSLFLYFPTARLVLQKEKPPYELSRSRLLLFPRCPY